MGHRLAGSVCISSAVAFTPSELSLPLVTDASRYRSRLRSNPEIEARVQQGLIIDLVPQHDPQLDPELARIAGMSSGSNRWSCITGMGRGRGCSGREFKPQGHSAIEIGRVL